MRLMIPRVIGINSCEFLPKTENSERMRKYSIYYKNLLLVEMNSRI